MAAAILLLSNLPNDIAFAEEVSATAELALLKASTPEEAAKIVAEKEPSVIFVDTSTEAQYSAFEKVIQESVGLFSDKINANAIHFLSSAQLEEVPYLIRSPLFGHLIMRNYGDPKAAGKHYGRIVKAAQNERAFGLKNLMKSEAKVQEVKLASTAKKQEAVEAVRNYLIAAKFQTRMATVVANAVDELLMNAMFDAPVDDLGKPTLSNTSRAAVFELKGQNAVELQVGYDGNYVAVTAIDHFGSLDKNKLLAHISKIYTEEEYKIKTSIAGAGIGLATVFRSGGSFFFVSEAHSRTEVTVFFQRTQSFREFKDQFRFISTQFYF